MSAIDDSTLIFSARGRLLAYLATHPDSTNEKLRRALFVTERTIYATVTALRKAGLITSKHVGNHRFAYRVKSPALAADLRNLIESATEVLSKG